MKLRMPVFVGLVLGLLPAIASASERPVVVHLARLFVLSTGERLS
jgi:hypothetical protein